MSDINPSIPGGLPPKPAESAKVQPKKETVRISLPPKPTSAPTIKLPTLPSGPAQASAATAAPPAIGIPASASAAPTAQAQGNLIPKPPTAAAPASKVAGGSPNRAGAPASATVATAPQKVLTHRPPSPVATGDKVLAVLVALVTLGAAGITTFIAFYLTNTGGTPPS